MFIDYVKKALIAAISTIKHFSLAVKNKFLKVQRYGFGNAEILGILRYTQAHFLTNAEEMIYSIAAGEYDGRMSLNINFLLAEFLRWNGLQPYKGMKIKQYVIFPAQFKIWRFIAFGL